MKIENCQLDPNRFALLYPSRDNIDESEEIFLVSVIYGCRVAHSIYFKTADIWVLIYAS